MGDPDDPERYLANPILVVGDAGMAAARSLAEIGYDVRLAQIRDDESLQIVWRSDEAGVTIELDDHTVEHAELVYVAEEFERFVRVVRVARQIGAAVVWSPFTDHDGQQRRIVGGAGLVFVSGSDIVVMARRQLRRSATERLVLLDAIELAQQRWPEVSDIVYRAADRSVAHRRLMELVGLSEAGAHFVLDLPLGRITELARDETHEERAAVESQLREH